MPAKKPMTVSSAAKLQINSHWAKKDWCKLPQPQTPVAHTDTQKIQTHVTPCMLKYRSVLGQTDSLTTTAYTALAQRHIVKIIFRSLIANT